MNGVVNGVTRALPHLGLVLGILLIALNVADYFNGSMGFLDGDAARLIMLALGVTAIANAAVLIRRQSKDQAGA
jgi:hypothetical protein